MIDPGKCQELFLDRILVLVTDMPDTSRGCSSNKGNHLAQHCRRTLLDISVVMIPSKLHFNALSSYGQNVMVA